jgi:hypothetical protein
MSGRMAVLIRMVSEMGKGDPDAAEGVRMAMTRGLRDLIQYLTEQMSTGRLRPVHLHDLAQDHGCSARVDRSPGACRIAFDACLLLADSGSRTSVWCASRWVRHRRDRLFLASAGRLLMQGVFARDLPIVRALVLLFSAAFILLNLLVDISYRYLDPFIRYWWPAQPFALRSTSMPRRVIGR